jgi:hypothetical protein
VCGEGEGTEGDCVVPVENALIEVINTPARFFSVHCFFLCIAIASRVLVVMRLLVLKGEKGSRERIVVAID